MSLGEIVVLVVIALYIIVSAGFRSEPRVAIALALALLIVTAIAMVLGRNDFAEQLANYVFYFMAAAVVLFFLDYIRKDSKGGK